MFVFPCLPLRKLRLRKLNNLPNGTQVVNVKLALNTIFFLILSVILFAFQHLNSSFFQEIWRKMTSHQESQFLSKFPNRLLQMLNTLQSLIHRPPNPNQLWLYTTTAYAPGKLLTKLWSIYIFKVCLVSSIIFQWYSPLPSSFLTLPHFI